MKTNLSVALILILLASVFGTLPSLIHADQPSSPSISLAAVPPQLPADGRAYDSLVIQILNPQGVPTIPRTAVNITLTSSKTSVGNIEPFVALDRGQFYAKAKFYTTRTPGITEITAIAEGYGAAQLKVTTVLAGGTPAKLSVYFGPGSLLPDRGVSSSVVVQLQDLRGIPARAPADVDVTLTSSRIAVGSVTPKTGIRKGTTFTTAIFTATDAAGATTITASASGYEAGSAVMSSLGPTPEKLVVFAAPPVIRATNGEQSLVVVQLRGFDDRPAKAPSDIIVSFSSSNATVGGVDSTVLILSGSTHSSAKFLATGATGRTEITASSPGFLAGSASITAAPQALDPVRVQIYLAPDTLLPDNGQYQSVVIQLLNKSGFPASIPSDQNIILSASNTEVGRVPGGVMIPAGANFAVASFETTFLAGGTEITAHANNLQKSQASMSSSGPVPSKLAVYSTPNVLAADAGAYKSIVIQLQDVAGSPAKAPRDILVTLSSSKTDIGTVDSTVVIPSGATYVLAEFRSTATAGKTDITAIATGYEPSSYELTTVEPYPSKLAVYTSPPLLVANGKTYDSVVVQLQDSSGNPATLANPLAISLSSSASRFAKVANASVIPAGLTFTVVPLQVNTAEGEFSIFAFATGFTTGSTNVKTVALKPTLTINPSQGVTLKKGQILELTIQTSLDGAPMEGATVSGASTSGTITPDAAITDTNGMAKLTYSAQSPGSALLAIGVSAPGYAPASMTIPVTVEDTGGLGFLETLGRFQGIPILLLVIAGAAAAVTGFLIIRHRRAAAEPTEEIEEIDYPESSP